MYVDRRTGQMSLNGNLDVDRISDAAKLCAVDTNVPFGKDKVITCYGIIGMLSLATSELISSPTALELTLPQPTFS